jgi:hypothetical protein
LRFTFDNIYFLLCTGLKITNEFTSINVKVSFWFPCQKVRGRKFPNIDIDAKFTSIDVYNISDLPCAKIESDRTGNNNGGTVRKRSGDKENIELHG